MSSGRPDAVPVSAAEVTVVYRPERDGDPDPGEVIWTWVPYEDDPSQGKDRPVVCLGVAGDDLVVIPLSSKDPEGRRHADEWVEIGKGQWDREGRPSFANVDRLLRVAPNVVRREGSVLDRERFDLIVDAARRWHPDLGEPVDGDDERPGRGGSRPAAGSTDSGRTDGDDSGHTDGDSGRTDGDDPPPTMVFPGPKG